MSKITDTIFQQIMEVRAGGQCNMLDTTAVQRYAFDHDLYELVDFIETKRHDYVIFILRGESDNDE
jgi:hypothetical protein